MHYFCKRIKRLHFKLGDLTSILPQSRLIAVRKKLLLTGGKGREFLSNNFGNFVCDSAPLQKAASSQQQKMRKENKPKNVLLAVSFPLNKVNSKFFLSAKSSVAAQHNSCLEGFGSKVRDIVAVKTVSASFRL